MNRALPFYGLFIRSISQPPGSLGCPCSKKDDHIVIDCSGCDGPQDLGQLCCLRGCIRSISYAGEVDRIALSKDVVVEYRGRSIAALQKMSLPLARSRTVGRTISRRCSKCPIEPSRLLDRVWSVWPPMPPPESFRVPFHQVEGAQCIACRNRSIATMETTRQDLAVASKQLNQLAVRVLGGRN